MNKVITINCFLGVPLSIQYELLDNALDRALAGLSLNFLFDL